MATRPSDDPAEVGALKAVLVERGARRQAVETMMPTLERAALVERVAQLRAQQVPLLEEQARQFERMRGAKREVETAEGLFNAVQADAAHAAQRVNVVVSAVTEAEGALGALDDLHGWSS